MKRSITQIFHLQVLLFAFSVISVLIASTILIQGHYRKKRISSEFHHELVLTASNFYHKVLMAEENIKALSSRTMIRKSLYDLAVGEAGLEETREYTQGKYEDGVQVYSDAVYARRIDREGRLIADYPPNNPDGIIFPSRNLSFFRNEKGCHLVFSNPIIQNGLNIGTDQAVFFLCDFPESDFIFLKNISVVKSPAADRAFSRLAETVPLGETDFFLYGELNRNAAREDSFKSLVISLLEAFVIILVISLLSYFTIMRLLIVLIRKQEKDKELSARQEKEAAISQIIAGLAHEINNVLTGIFGLSDSLEMMSDFPDEGKPLLEDLKGSSSRMTHFVKKLTDYSRQNFLIKGKVEMGKTVKDIIGKWKGDKRYSGIINLESPVDDLIAEIGEIHLNQILSNILDNAAESMKVEGEINLFLDRAAFPPGGHCLRCQESLGKSWIRLRIADKGEGIPLDLTTRIFDPFFSTKDRKEGLGLAQASGLVTRYDGHIFVGRTSAEGTEIVLLLPDACKSAVKEN